jgi:hypothetical protein
MAGEPVVDMRWGVYRKVYSGFIWGDRLNSVSMEAEAWFWRLHAVADDLGNLAANMNRLVVEAGGKRQITPEQAEKWTAELASVRLIVRYSVGSDNYVHIIGFEDRQPANKNGRRIQRHPLPPKDQTGTEMVTLGNPTEPDLNCRESKSPTPTPTPNPIPNPNPTPTPNPTTRTEAVSSVGSSIEAGMPPDTRAKFDALTFAGVGDKRAAEFAAIPYFTLESIRRVANLWRRDGKPPDGRLVKALETAVRQDLARHNAAKGVAQ